MGAFVVLLAGQRARSAPLEEYTGMSNPASLDLGKRRSQDPKVLAVAFFANRKKGIAFAAAGKREAKEVAGTIYSMVLDQNPGEGKTVDPNDPWGSTIADFTTRFKVSSDSWQQKLDTSARYLYLYQVFNDCDKSDGWVYRAGIRLLIDPRLVTSWGYIGFSAKSGAPQGAGFALPEAKEDAPGVRPVVCETVYGGVRDYKPDAPYLRLKEFSKRGTKFFRVTTIPAHKGEIVGVAAGDPITRLPNKVSLVLSANFDETKQPRYRMPERTDDERRLAPTGRWRTWSWAQDARIRGMYDIPLDDETGLPLREDARADRDRLLRDRDRDDRDRLDRDGRPRRTLWPIVRASFQDDPIKNGERSTIFGFTSNYPPVYDYGILHEQTLPGLGRPGAAADKPAGALDPDRLSFIFFQAGGAPAPGAAPGGQPTPITPAAAAAGAAAPAAGAAGAVGGVGGFPAGGIGGFPGGFGGGFPSATPGAPTLAPPSASGGGGSGGGTGSGSGQGTPTQNQAGQQAQAGQQNQNQTPTVVNNNNIVVSQNQQQSQQQQQSQSQSQQQSQKQRQNQQQNQSPNGNVVPAPPAWLLGLLGLPVFGVLARRRKKRAEVPSDNP
jgi:hypothetical protein